LRLNFIGRSESLVLRSGCVECLLYTRFDVLGPSWRVRRNDVDCGSVCLDGRSTQRYAQHNNRVDTLRRMFWIGLATVLAVAIAVTLALLGRHASSVPRKRYFFKRGITDVVGMDQCADVTLALQTMRNAASNSNSAVMNWYSWATQPAIPSRLVRQRGRR